jgi:hypothetical protein
MTVAFLVPSAGVLKVPDMADDEAQVELKMRPNIGGSSPIQTLRRAELAIDPVVQELAT